LRKYREPQKGKKTRRLESKNLNTEKLKTKPVIWKKNCWVLNANKSSDWIIHQSAIFGLAYNPSTYTILKYCSIGDSTSGKFRTCPMLEEGDVRSEKKRKTSQKI